MAGSAGRGAKVPNLVLRRVREEERRETRLEFADALARAAAEIGETIVPPKSMSGS